MASVATIMHKHIVGVAVGTQLKTALRLMKLNRVSLVPVLKEGRLVGILTLKTAERKLAEGNEPTAGEAMEAPFAYVPEDASIEEAAKALASNNITRLPIVNNRSEMRCVGIVTSTDVVGANR